MKTKAREFALAPILTVTTGKLLCEIGELYDILNFMTGDNLMTHQLPRAARACEPELLRQHPRLLTEAPDYLNTKETVEFWVSGVASVMKPRTAWPWGLKVKPLDTWELKNPLIELQEMRPDAPIIAVTV